MWTNVLERNRKIFNFKRFYLQMKIPIRIPFYQKKKEDHIKPYQSTYFLHFTIFASENIFFCTIDSISLCRNTRTLNAGRI